MGYYVVSKGDLGPFRVKIRSASFNNVSIASWVLRGVYVPDIITSWRRCTIILGDIDRRSFDLTPLRSVRSSSMTPSYSPAWQSRRECAGHRDPWGYACESCCSGGVAAAERSSTSSCSR